MTHWIAIIACLIGVSVVNAQSCGTRIHTTHSGYTYTTPVIEKVVVKEVLTPVAVPVIIPQATFQYLPALAPAVAVAPVVAAPVAPAAPPPAAAAPDIDRLVRERVDAILREKLGRVQDDDEPPPLQVVGGRPTPVDSTPVVQQVANLLANHCAKCHTAGVKTAGDVTLFVKKGEQLEFRPSVSKSAIVAAVTPSGTGAARMPPTAKTDPATALKPQDVALLRRWDSLP